jgi:hypothetical protein
LPGAIELPRKHFDSVGSAGSEHYAGARSMQRSHKAFPNPLDAPVTIATRPLKKIGAANNHRSEFHLMVSAEP